LPGAGPGTYVTETELLARDYHVDVGACLNHAWEVFKADPGIIIGVSLLVYLAIMGIAIVSMAIPAAGSLVSLALNGPLMGGLWLFYIKRVRSHPAGVADAFSGFGPRFTQLMLTSIIPGLISFGVIALFGIVAAILLPSLALAGRARGGPPPGAATFLIPLSILLFIGILVMVYLTTCWMFGLALVADKGLRFWPALELSRRVVSKHWWMTFWLLVVMGFLAVIGAMACGLGMLVTAPVAFAMVVSHYQRVFGDLTPKTD
jgi:hypothetical protein